jgi:hypothetical protein
VSEEEIAAASGPQEMVSSESSETEDRKGVEKTQRNTSDYGIVFEGVLAKNEASSVARKVPEVNIPTQATTVVEKPASSNSKPTSGGSVSVPVSQSLQYSPKHGSFEVATPRPWPTPPQQVRAEYRPFSGATKVVVGSATPTPRRGTVVVKSASLAGAAKVVVPAHLPAAPTWAFKTPSSGPTGQTILGA